MHKLVCVFLTRYNICFLMIQVAGYVNISISDPSKAFVSCLLSIL